METINLEDKELKELLELFFLFQNKKPYCRTARLLYAY